MAIPTSDQKGGFEEKEELVQALIGASAVDVNSQLGQPTDTYELPEVTYLFYKRDAKQKWFSLAHPIAMFWYQFPVGWGSADVFDCLLIETRNDEVVHAEIKTYRDLTGAAAFALTQPEAYKRWFKGCPSLFWEDKELERIGNAAKNHEST